MQSNNTQDIRIEFTLIYSVIALLHYLNYSHIRIRKPDFRIIYYAITSISINKALRA